MTNFSPISSTPESVYSGASDSEEGDYLKRTMPTVVQTLVIGQLVLGFV